MSHYYAIVCAIGALFLLAEPVCAENTRSFSAIERQMQELVASGEAPSVSAAVIQGGQPTWLHAEGWADIEARIPATPDTIYRIGSVSKSITGTVIMLAAGSGDVDMSQQLCMPIMTHRPSVRRNYCRDITLADAINMSAGMPQAVYYPGISDGWPQLTVDAFLNQYAFSITGAGDSYDYSNMGPALAARAVEQSLEESFQSYARRNLLSPLGMSATFYEMREAPCVVRAASYNRHLHRFKHTYETEPAVAAGMVSSVRDLTSFALLHMGSSSILSQEQIDALHAPATADFYGFGWGRISQGERTFLISDGQVNGGQAIIIIEPARGVGEVVVANAASDRINELALMILEEVSPGVSDAFEQGVAEIESRIAQRAQLPPKDAQWSRRGRLFVDGKPLPITLAAYAGRINIRVNNAVAIHGTSLSPEKGYARWSLPCPTELPACIGNAEATLSLTRASRGLVGVITVTSLHGQFPYGVYVN